MKPTDDKLTDLARIVSNTAATEIDCREMLNRFAAYVQACTQRKEITDALRQVSQHLRICPECVEELAALLRAEGIDPETVMSEVI